MYDNFSRILWSDVSQILKLVSWLRYWNALSRMLIRKMDTFYFCWDYFKLEYLRQFESTKPSFTSQNENNNILFSLHMISQSSDINVQVCEITFIHRQKLVMHVYVTILWPLPYPFSRGSEIYLTKIKSIRIKIPDNAFQYIHTHTIFLISETSEDNMQEKKSHQFSNEMRVIPAKFARPV